MSSVNEQLPPPPKPRMSPLDFRNTDLVSRLLAATPPYLYNMSLLPNTYFFSEMLRSFVQAKAESSNRPLSTNLPSRRTRKRSWTSSRSEIYHKPEISPKPDPPSSDWFPKKYPQSKADSTRDLADKEVDSKLTANELTGRTHNQIFPPHPNPNQESNVSNLILPPPPPMWYPPLYPTAPYGIDPLHFFIDLRVSGHIYDRNKQRGETEAPLPPDPDLTKDQLVVRDGFRPSRHASAFSVPVSTFNRTTPMNLTSGEDHHTEMKSSKFDVMSMGLDKQCNKIGTTYVMGNIETIYKNLTCRQNIKHEETSSTKTNEDNDKETEEEKQKRVKDLRALIGLELVVDYMNHAKPNVKTVVEESSSTDDDSVHSPALEVVALHDET